MIHNRIFYTLIISAGLLAAFVLLLGEQPLQAQDAEQETLPFGYGFNVAVIDVDKVEEMGFNWIKIFGPPGERYPVNVMLRIDVTIEEKGDTAGVAAQVAEIASLHGSKIDAYEIGNEVNLDASYGWGGPPDAADYVELLCAAYTEIKTHDPSAIVISAGLAPVGRVPDTWEGHLGHNGLYQDDREYLKEMITAIDAHGSPCLDAVGYHNYGFSADFDTPPDTPFDQITSPETNCSNGFCFRGVEPIYEIMQDRGWGDYQVWSTETGWIIDPADVGYPACASDASLAGREWQFVTSAKQAENLAGAMTYAAENYPWMGGVILFNLNFNKASYYRDCEQMRFYGVQGWPAEEALREIPKIDRLSPGELVHTQVGAWSTLVQTDTAPFTMTFGISLTNRGDRSITYTLRPDQAGELIPIGVPVTQMLEGGNNPVISLTLPYSPHSVGRYTGTLFIDVDPNQSDYPTSLPLTIDVVAEKRDMFLPYILKTEN